MVIWPRGPRVVENSRVLRLFNETCKPEPHLETLIPYTAP